MRNTLRLITLLLALSSASLCFARTAGACLENMDDNIGTLYLCGVGGQFKVLSLDRCNLTDADMPMVMDYLAKNPRINALDLGQNQLSDDGMKIIAKNTHLAWLNVSYNNIRDAGAAALATMQLTHLNIIANHVGDAGAKELAKNTTLQLLDLSRNLVTSTGAAALASQRAIQILYLDHNQITDVSALGNDKHLTHLYLTGNAVSDDGAAQLALNKSLLHLSLIQNQIHDQGAFALVANTTLRWLYLDDNHISGAGIAALNSNPNYIEVSTSGNDGTLRKKDKSIMLKPDEAAHIGMIKSFCE